MSITFKRMMMMTKAMMMQMVIMIGAQEDRAEQETSTIKTSKEEMNYVKMNQKMQQQFARNKQIICTQDRW